MNDLRTQQFLEAVADLTPEEQRHLIAAWRYHKENRDKTPEECMLYVMNERDRV